MAPFAEGSYNQVDLGTPIHFEVGGAVEGPKTPLERKLEKGLIKRFPAPATVGLKAHDGIIGDFISDAFAGMASIDRQSLIGNFVVFHLAPQVRCQVQVIGGVTQDERTDYLEGEQ